jgi:glycosyltransferase involved in cell wall biosynthesis
MEAVKAHERKTSVLVVASPSHKSGGTLRAFRSLREYSKYFKTSLFIPWSLWVDKNALQDSISYLRDLRRIGVRLAGFSQVPKVVYKSHEILGTRIFKSLLPLTVPKIARLKVGAADYSAVIALHEDWEVVYSGNVLAELFNAPNAVLLQLPPFYGSRKRFLNIMRAVLLWRELIGGTTVEKSLFRIEAVTRRSVEEWLGRLRYEETLRRYTLVLGVSKAIAADMGGEWLGKVVCFDPGVSLDHEDMAIIRSVRERVRGKENYVVFGGRPSADKGLAEALISFKLISKHVPGIKLVVTGKVTPKILAHVKRVCRRLGIDDKVVFTGFIPREERFEVVARARLMLYPSHVDSFSYAVLESLHLGTPVVAYRIPAIEIYYGKSPGVELVEECDLEALTTKAVDVLEKGVEAIEPPKIKSWEEIMNEEIEIISKLASQHKATFIGRSSREI